MNHRIFLVISAPFRNQSWKPFPKVVGWLLLIISLTNCVATDREESALAGFNCAKSLSKPACRKTVQNLIARKQFGFHITAAQNIEGILKDGLLASYGGQTESGLCGLLINSKNPNGRKIGAIFQNKSKGFIFFAKDLEIIKELSLCHQNDKMPYTILGFGLDELTSKGYEVDPEYGHHGAYRTKQNIPPSQLIDLGTDMMRIKRDYFPKEKDSSCLPSR